MPRFALIIFVLILLAGCEKRVVLLGKGCDGEAAIPISLTELLVKGRDYDGVCVGVRGYLSSGNPKLFLTKEHADIQDVASSIWVLDNTEDADIYLGCSGNYVKVTGKVGLVEDVAVGIVDVDRVFKVNPNEEPGYCYGGI